jgi:predicted nucleotide-binding protein
MATEQQEIAAFRALLRHADKYIRYPRTSTGSAAARWRNRGVTWLRRNLPDSGLDLEFVTTGRINEAADRLNASDVVTVQRGLKVLVKAQDLLVFLKDGARSLPRPGNARKVFIVHGHNDSLKTASARLVEKLGLEAVILHEQPNRGRTIIEKFLSHSDVAFAIVLLTADDKGGSAKEPSDSFRLRARQNVILELGFFLGKLGRERVVAVYEHEVEIPSDYSGVLFVPYDLSGSWQYGVAKEMREAGLKLDLNKL